MSTSQSKQPNGIDLIIGFVNSSIGSKVIMGLTGLIMWGFIIGHLIGNLQVFLPGSYPGELLNDYAHALKGTPPLLWGTRITIFGAVVLHVITAVRLVSKNRSARETRYAISVSKKATIASKLMPVSGVIVGAFIVFHIVHFTLPVGFTEYLGFVDQKGNHDVYKMVSEAFSHWYIVGFYLLAQIFLFMHLYHGSSSLWQSFGFRNPRWTPLISFGGKLVVCFLLIGNVMIPLYIFLTLGLKS